MSGTRAMAETFSIEFDGPAFDKYQIPAAALAQSLLALDDLAKRISDVAYGKEAEAEIKVNAFGGRGECGDSFDRRGLHVEETVAAGEVGPR